MLLNDSLSYIINKMDNNSSNGLSDSKINFGNPKLAPRVGDQYQAKIPPLVINLCCQENDLNDVYSTGLPVSITWAELNVEQVEKESENIALPISPCKPWKAIELESFVVGLYIFGKNLNNVRKFVKSKQLGEIVRYYYGKFYMSSGYNRCFRGKKMKRRSSVRGERIFAGWRRKELLSRLFSRASEESRGLLREINMKYEEDKISLEKYVFTLRRIVGLENLIEALSIGKGKRDLTRTVNPKKNENLPPHIPKIPNGKKLSSLTPREIAQFLTKIRLSKTRLNDLFWEAIWPRLLENGWRSEQPKYLAIFNSKQNLVFIVPGVGKFSRRSLIKGHQYFDSVKEVLDRVASDPSILTLKADEKTEHEEKETEMTQDQNGDVEKFTIVDTSLRYGRETSKIVEMRTLPVETDYDISVPSHSSSETEHESSEDDIYESDTRNNSPELTSIQGDDAKPTDGSKSADGESNEDKSPHDNSLDAYENISSDGSLAEESQDVDEEDVDRNEQKSAEESQDVDEEDVDCNEQKSRSLIDINLPSSTQELETNGTSVKKPVNNHGHSDTSSKVDISLAKEQCVDTLNGRRQSTRNRPLTTKVLEAIAYGFLTPNKKRKNVGIRDKYMSSRAKLAKSSDSSSEDNNTASK